MYPNFFLTLGIVPPVQGEGTDQHILSIVLFTYIPSPTKNSLYLTLSTKKKVWLNGL